MVRSVKSNTISESIKMNSLARRVFLFLIAVLFASFTCNARAAQEMIGARVLLLGDNGHHHPADFFKAIQAPLRRNGIDVTYTESLADLNAAKLAGYDCLMIFANWTQIEPE